MYKFAYLSSTLALSAICALDTLVPCVPCALHTLVLSVFLWLVLPLCLFRKLISCYFFFWQILFICSCVLFDYQYFDYLYLFNNSTYELIFFFFFFSFSYFFLSIHLFNQSFKNYHLNHAQFVLYTSCQIQQVLQASQG